MTLQSTLYFTIYFLFSQIVLLQILKSTKIRFVHKCPGGTSDPSLLLQTQQLNKTSLLRTTQQKKLKSKNSVK